MVFDEEQVRVTATSAAAMAFALFFAANDTEDMEDKVVKGITAWCKKCEEVGVTAITHGFEYFQEMMDLYLEDDAH
eukprot:Pgem_evm1s16069